MEIYCDSCGMEIEQNEELIRKRVLARDEEGGNVEEKYFECANCGQHFTILVADHKTKIMIQRRMMIQMRLKSNSTRARRTSVRRQMLEEDEELKEAIKARSDMLKERYLEEGAR